MHGVKRLFAWMIPRFDRAALQRVAHQPAAEGSVARTRWSSSASTSPTWPAQVRSRDLSGAAAGAAGQAGRRRAHARLRRDDVRAAVRVAAGDSRDPARARQPHRHAVVSEGRRSAARAAHRPGDRRLGVDGRVHDPRAADAGRADQGRLSRRAARRVCARRATAEEIAAARARARHRARDDRRRHGDAADAVERQPVSRRRGARDRPPSSRASRVFIVGEGRAAGASSRRRRGRSVSAIGWSSPASSAMSPRCSTALDIVVFPSLWEGTPLTAFEALAAGKPIVATDADGLLDILTDRHDSLVVPKRNAGGAGARHRRADRSAASWRQRLAADARATGARTISRVFVRKMERLYEILHETSRATRRAGVLNADLSFLTAKRMTAPTPPSDRRFARRIGHASRLTALGARAPRVGADRRLPEGRRGGVLQRRRHLLQPGAQPRARTSISQFRREDLRARLARVSRPGPKASSSSAAATCRACAVGGSSPFVEIDSRRRIPMPTRLYYGKSFIFPLFAAPFVWLFGTNGFLVLHALLMTLCFACAYAFLVARSAPIAGAASSRRRFSSSRSRRSTWCG